MFHSYIMVQLGSLNSIVTTVTNETACFLKGTKILVLNKQWEEVYIPIEDLNEEYLIKTYLHGYRRIKLLGNGKLMNNVNSITSCLYKLKSMNELFDDLIVTGGHSILVSELSAEEELKQRLVWENMKKMDDKYLLLAGISSDFEKIMDNNEYEIFHICCEDEDNHDQQYGIYANGILTESISYNSFHDYFQ